MTVEQLIRDLQSILNKNIEVIMQSAPNHYHNLRKNGDVNLNFAVEEKGIYNLVTDSDEHPDREEVAVLWME